MPYTKSDFAREFNLPESEVDETLLACRLSVKKKNYTESDRERFKEARDLFVNGQATSYDEVATYFDEPVGEGDDTPTGEMTPSVLDKLRQEAIAHGFQLGLEQAEIIAQVVPLATMRKLEQMIANGELRQSLQELWSQSFPKNKRRSVTTEELEAHWTTYQLDQYQEPLESLPPSSTELSESD